MVDHVEFVEFGSRPDMPAFIDSSNETHGRHRGHSDVAGSLQSSDVDHGGAGIAEDETAGLSEPWLACGQIPLLDGFRAVAVLMVLVAHASQTSGFPELGGCSAILKRGAVGVDLFFVISGFLITTLLIREHNRNGRVSLKKFISRRCLRILPAYFCLLSAVFLLQSLGVVSLGLKDWAAAVTHTMNFVQQPAWELGHTWSLSIEEHFYLIWPLAFAVLGSTRCIGAAVGCIAIGFGIRLGLLMWCPEDAWMAGRWTFTRMDSIAIGCLLALVVQTPRYRIWISRVCSVRYVPGLAVFGLVVSTFLSEYSYRYRVALGYPLDGLLLGVLIWSTLLRQDQPRLQVLDSRWLKAIGIRSYSIYLWQQLFLNPNGNSVLQAYPWNLTCALAAGCLSYRFIELPILRLRSRLFSSQGTSTLPNSLEKTVNRAANTGGWRLSTIQNGDSL